MAKTVTLTRLTQGLTCDELGTLGPGGKLMKVGESPIAYSTWRFSMCTDRHFYPEEQSWNG